MANVIIEGCYAEVVGTDTPKDGTLILVLFKGPALSEGTAWVVATESDDGGMETIDIQFEYNLRRIATENAGRELCTSWDDIKTITNGWVPAELKEIDD